MIHRGSGATGALPGPPINAGGNSRKSRGARVRRINGRIVVHFPRDYRTKRSYSPRIVHGISPPRSLRIARTEMSRSPSRRISNEPDFRLIYVNRVWRINPPKSIYVISERITRTFGNPYACSDFEAPLDRKNSPVSVYGAFGSWKRKYVTSYDSDNFCAKTREWSKCAISNIEIIFRGRERATRTRTLRLPKRNIIIENALWLARI